MLKKKSKLKKASKAKKSKKTAKKTVKKKTLKKVVKKKKGPKKSAAKAAVKKPVIEGRLIGTVTHYFPHVNAAVVKVEKGNLRVGDLVRFHGHTTDFKEEILSIQMDHKPVDKALPGEEVGVEVKARVREGDSVYKITA